MSGVERVRVGDVLRLERRSVDIDPLSEYRLIGVYSFGKGIFHRDLQSGAELGDYRFFRVEPADLVLSNIQAWEGAIAVATDADRGAIGTHRFLTYVPRTDRINTSWARWFLLSEPGMRLIRQAAPGTAVRNRTLAVKRFEDLVIPLPPPDEQRRVAARLDAMRGRLGEVADRQGRVRAISDPAVDSAIERVIERGRASAWRQVELGELADVNPRRAKVPPDELISFVPMASVSAERGAVEVEELRPAGEVNGSYRQFMRGDIIFARITPCMQNGKSAIFDGPPEYGYGSSEFHIVRAHDERTTSWLHRYLRTRGLRDAAAQRMTGTAGQQRVPASFLESVPVPLPPDDELDAAVAAVDRLNALRLRLHTLDRQGQQFVAATQPALLNELFSGLA